MKKILSKAIILFIIFHLSALGQTTYYVSNSIGDDNSDGSIDSPFETIGKAISKIDAGDSVIIRGGLYHEEILIDNLNSSISSPTLIKSFDGETVVIDGTIEILGQWNDDNSNSSIKVVNGIDDHITQLFVGNKQMVMARWPNAQFNDQSIFDKHNWAEGDESTSQDGQLYIDESKKDPGTINLTNSVGILNVGSFKTFNKRITNHTIQNGNDLIEYDGNFGNSFKTKHHYFFFEGKKELIDVQNEWFLDQENEMLFVFPPNGVDLNNASVRGKVRDYSVLIDNSSHVTIEGLTFFATTFKADNSSYLNISDCNFYYPSYSRRMLGELQGAAPTTLGSSGTKRVYNSTIDRCLFIDTEGEGLIIMGDNNKVLNSYFKNIDWSATELDGLMVTINIDGSNNEFSNNEVYNTGASATVWPGEESIFSYNVVSNTGLAQSDGAVFQGTKNTVAKSVVHHNFVYDTEKYAFRYDAPGGNAEEAGSFGIMHHNIADNTMGLMIKGNNQIIANNTVINTINNRNDIIILAEDCSNNHTWLYNNLAERIGSHRSSTQFELDDDAPIPIGSYGYIMYDSDNNGSKDSWRACVESDGNIFSGTGSGVSMDNIDQITASRTGISVESDVTALLTYNSSNEKNVTNYVPSSNVLIDKGSDPTNQVYISNTELKSLDELVPQTDVGNLPDIGAIDQTNVWTPGIDWVPEENFDIVNALTLTNPTIVKEEIFVYPNPTNGIIKISPDRNLEFSVFDINGTIISKGFGNTINLSSFANGVYFLKVKTQNSRMYTILKE
tara:strand:+ start:157 stop:2508 length:2352 start_codon:yes stop_codon:yes gene_type:complete